MGRGDVIFLPGIGAGTEVTFLLLATRYIPLKSSSSSSWPSVSAIGGAISSSFCGCAGGMAAGGEGCIAAGGKVAAANGGTGPGGKTLGGVAATGEGGKTPGGIAATGEGGMAAGGEVAAANGGTGPGGKTLGGVAATGEGGKTPGGIAATGEGGMAAGVEGGMAAANGGTGPGGKTPGGIAATGVAATGVAGTGEGGMAAFDRPTDDWNEKSTSYTEVVGGREAVSCWEGRPFGSAAVSLGMFETGGVGSESSGACSDSAGEESSFTEEGADGSDSRGRLLSSSLRLITMIPFVFFSLLVGSVSGSEGRSFSLSLEEAAVESSW
jgi:hypothetical protein